MFSYPPWKLTKRGGATQWDEENHTRDSYLNKNDSQIDLVQQSLWIYNIVRGGEIDSPISVLKPCDRALFLSRVPLRILTQASLRDPSAFWKYARYISKPMIHRWKTWDRATLQEAVANRSPEDYLLCNITAFVNCDWNFSIYPRRRSLLDEITLFCQTVVESKAVKCIMGTPGCLNLVKRKTKSLTLSLTSSCFHIYLIGAVDDMPKDVQEIYPLGESALVLHTYPYASLQHLMLDQHFDVCLDISSQTFWSLHSFLTDFKIRASAASTHQLTVKKKTHVIKPNFQHQLSSCYHCQKWFHPNSKPGFIRLFYESFCYACSMEHIHRRVTPLPPSLNENKFALVTGGRIKIGYTLSLQLLKCGYTVITTSRFPVHAWARYQTEPDFDQFESRLHIFKLDFRRLDMVEQFIAFLNQNVPRLNLLINNAAQTFTYDEDYYRQHIEYERDEIKRVTMDRLEEGKEIAHHPLALTHSHVETEDTPFVPMFELPSFPVDPFGELITKGGQFWNQRAHEVSTESLLTMQIVNYIVPSLFTIRLKSLMEETEGNKFIIQVTCREGNFSLPHKTIHHFHSNCAKASLNMLTRTISDDYAKSNIYVNNVDPGFVSFALNTTSKCPIDLQEASLRILNPMFQNPILHGKLWKNYQIISW